MPVRITRTFADELVRAHNDSPADAVVAVTRQGTVVAGPTSPPGSVWQCPPDERKAKSLTVEEAVDLLLALKATGAFDGA